MKKIIIPIIIGLLIFGETTFARDIITHFSNDVVPHLNEMIRRIWFMIDSLDATTNALDTRVDTLEANPNVISTGMIIMWSGSVATIPTGWVLCDGNNSTPDLRDKFIVGAKQDDGGIAKSNVKGSLLQTGGAHEHTLAESEMPSHTHSYTRNSNGPGAGEVTGLLSFNPTSPTTGATGGDGAHENCPPFYALAYIMKT